MSSNNGLLKRLDELMRQLRIRGERTIVVKVPTVLSSVEGSVEFEATVTPEVEEQVGELLKSIGADNNDTEIRIASFYPEVKTNGHTEPVEVAQVELVSIT
jgi:hypothetical protein